VSTPTLSLDVVPGPLHAQARRAFKAGDAPLLLLSAGEGGALALVFDNYRALLDRGIYEACLIDAYINRKTNNRAWDQRVIEWMFSLADRDRLRAVGSPLPGNGPFTLYRGIAGRGRARRARGMSWTPSLPVACWFASRFGLESPAVVTVTVPAADVLCYTNEREEEEFIVMPPAKVRRVRLTPEQIAAHAESVRAARQGVEA
jgi:hypothetical protein